MKNDSKLINKLIIDLSHNDEIALEQLFNLTKERLYYVACRYLEDESKAEDVLDLAFLKIYQNSSKFNKKYNGFNWMYEIVKNIALDQNREDLKHNFMEFNEEYYYSDALTNSIKQNRKIAIALKSLTKIELQIVVLKIWENKTFKEIAAEVNMNINSVYREYKTALEKIKENWLDTNYYK